MDLESVWWRVDVPIPPKIEAQHLNPLASVSESQEQKTYIIPQTRNPEPQPET